MVKYIATTIASNTFSYMWSFQNFIVLCNNRYFLLEGVSSSETSVDIHQTTLCNISEDIILDIIPQKV
jgi:hypothetical protein